MSKYEDQDYIDEVNRERREEDAEHKRMLEWARNHHRHPHDPDHVAPEAFCPTCNGFTTNITRRGECGDCNTEVRSEPNERNT